MFSPAINSADVLRVHDWRNDVTTIGHCPASMVSDATNGMVSKPWPAQLNRLVWEGNHDAIFSVGQVVPHEVMGMANFNKVKNERAPHPTQRVKILTASLIAEPFCWGWGG
jgi:hypothetical protein